MIVLSQIKDVYDVERKQIVVVLTLRNETGQTIDIPVSPEVMRSVFSLCEAGDVAAPAALEERAPTASTGSYLPADQPTAPRPAVHIPTALFQDDDGTDDGIPDFPVGETIPGELS